MLILMGKKDDSPVFCLGYPSFRLRKHVARGMCLLLTIHQTVDALQRAQNVKQHDSIYERRTKQTLSLQAQQDQQETQVCGRFLTLSREVTRDTCNYHYVYTVS